MVAISPDLGARKAPKHRGPAGPGTLTPRERSVVLLMGQGLSNKEIARELGNKPETIKTHVKSVFLKLGVARRAHAVYRAQAHGLFDAD